MAANHAVQSSANARDELVRLEAQMSGHDGRQLRETCRHDFDLGSTRRTNRPGPFDEHVVRRRRLYPLGTCSGTDRSDGSEGLSCQDAKVPSRRDVIANPAQICSTSPLPSNSLATCSQHFISLQHRGVRVKQGRCSVEVPSTCTWRLVEDGRSPAYIL